MNTSNKSPIPPAQLWIGSHKHLCMQAEQFLQKQFCIHDACSTCTTCRLIRERQYHGTIWLYPEKRYTLDQIQIIFKTISFSLAQDQKLFFIIQKADCLTTACSNKLLKSVEEPPPGYQFIFLTEHKDLILPTIRSRCIIHSYQTEKSNHEKEQLLSFFTTTTQSNPTDFTKMLDKIKPNEQESTELLDKLFIYWMQEAKKATYEQRSQKSHKASYIISVLGKAIQKPPMPGSSTIFWKNLFLQIKD